LFPRQPPARLAGIEPLLRASKSKRPPLVLTTLPSRSDGYALSGVCAHFSVCTTPVLLTSGNRRRA